MTEDTFLLIGYNNSTGSRLADKEGVLERAVHTMDRWQVWKAYKLADENRRAILDVVLRQVLEGQHQQQDPGEVVEMSAHQRKCEEKKVLAH